MWVSLRRVLDLRPMILAVALASPVLFGAGTATSAAEKVAVDQAEILHRALSANFAALDAMLVGYQIQFETDHASHALPEIAFGTFSNSDSALEPRLNEWVARMPNSYAAPLARGIFYQHLGALSRGAEFAAKTPDERFGEMRDFYAAAAADLGRALKLNARLIPAYRTLARIALASGRRGRAQQILADGLELYPEAVVLHDMFIETLEPKWGGSIAQLQAYIAALAKRFPDIRELNGYRGYVDYVQGNAAYFDGEYDVAQQYIDRALKVAPHATGYLTAEADIALMRGRRDDAAAIMSQVLALAPGSDFYHFKMSVYQTWLGRYSDALENANKAVAGDRLNPDYLQQRAVVWQNLNRHDQAVRDLDDAVIYGAYDPSIEIDRSRELAHFQARLPDAVEAGRLATKLSPRDPIAWATYAQALFMAQDCNAQQALTVFHAVCRAANHCDVENDFLTPELIPFMLCKKS